MNVDTEKVYLAAVTALFFAATWVLALMVNPTELNQVGRDMQATAPTTAALMISAGFFLLLRWNRMRAGSLFANRIFQFHLALWLLCPIGIAWFWF